MSDSYDPGYDEFGMLHENASEVGLPHPGDVSLATMNTADQQVFFSRLALIRSAPPAILLTQFQRGTFTCALELVLARAFPTYLGPR